jgi:RNA polymerase sigma-70 factor (ECF subfamily)
MNEIELIEQAVRGDLDAFNSLVLSYEDAAFNVAYRILNDPEQAEDATQVAVISMYRKLNTYRGGSFKGWFLRIVTNACYDELRRIKRRPTVPLEPETDDGEMVESPVWIEDPAAGPEEVLSANEMERAIQNCLNGLDEKFKVVIVMVDLSGEDYETVADIIQSPMGTVKSRLARARQKMQECLQDVGELLPAKYRLKDEANDDQSS